MEREKPMNDTFLDEARQQAAQCWCREDTSGITMDPRLAEAVARCISAWMDTAAEYARSVEYYRALLVRCGEALGDPAKTCDDGSAVPDVLVAKVPELVEAIVAKSRP